MATEVSADNNYSHFFGRLPKEVIYEDEMCVVFEEEEVRQAPVHFLVVPKKVISTLSQATLDDERLLGHLLLVAKKITTEKGLDSNGYHLMVDENFRSMRLNSLHVFGRALHHMLWPTGPGYRL